MRCSWFGWSQPTTSVYSVYAGDSVEIVHRCDHNNTVSITRKSYALLNSTSSKFIKATNSTNQQGTKSRLERVGKLTKTYKKLIQQEKPESICLFDVGRLFRQLFLPGKKTLRGAEYINKRLFPTKMWRDKVGGVIDRDCYKAQIMNWMKTNYRSTAVKRMFILGRLRNTIAQETTRANMLVYSHAFPPLPLFAFASFISSPNIRALP